jgi:hypothetical protein
MASSTPAEAFMSFSLLLVAGLGALVVVGLVVTIVLVASASRGREDDR